MIKVQFKNNYEDIYAGKEYTYKDFDGVEVGDIVVVNTNNGFALARISQVNVEDYTTNPDRLASIQTIVLTQKEIDEKEKKEYEKQLAVARFLEATKRQSLLDYLEDFTNKEEDKKLFETLTISELEKLCDALIK